MLGQKIMERHNKAVVTVFPSSAWTTHACGWVGLMWEGMIPVRFPDGVLYAVPYTWLEPLEEKAQ